MEPGAVTEHIRSMEGVDTLDTPGCVFFYYDPQRSIPHDRRHPFATIVVDDRAHGASDQASRLGERGLFRVNIGVERETYRAMLGPEPAWGDPAKGGIIEGPEYTRVDTWLPHPVYAPMSWVCIVSPSDASWPRVAALIREAHAKARREHGRRAGL